MERAKENSPMALLRILLLVVVPIVVGFFLTRLTLGWLNRPTKPAAGSVRPGNAMHFALGGEYWKNERVSHFGELARAAVIRSGVVDPGMLDFTNLATGTGGNHVLTARDRVHAISTIELAEPECTLTVRWTEHPTELLTVTIGPEDSKAKEDSISLSLERGDLGASSVVPCEVLATVYYSDGEKKQSTRDQVRFIRTVPHDIVLGTGLVTTTLEMDEEALATWFIDVVRRYGRAAQAASTVLSESSPVTALAPSTAPATAVASDAPQVAGSDSKSEERERPPHPVELTDDGVKRLTRAISELVKFRFGGSTSSALHSEAASALPIARDTSDALRWSLWINGGDWFASTMLFGIYFLSAVAVCHLVIRFVFNLPMFRTSASEMNIVAFASAKGLLSTPERRDEARAVWDSRGWFANWLEGAIPAVGFIGTIVGLGSAFGSVGIISQIDVIQRQSLMGVLLDLGTAFSTTFWALILSALLVVPLNALVRSCEERSLVAAADAKRTTEAIHRQQGLDPALEPYLSDRESIL